MYDIMRPRNFVILFALPYLVMCVDDWPGCNHLISEIKINYKKDGRPNIQYVETMRECERTLKRQVPVSASEFHLVFIHGVSEQIIMTCQFKNKMTIIGPSENQRQVYVVGSSATERTNMKINECTTPLVDKDTLPPATVAPVGVLLLKIEKGVSLKNLKITQQKMNAGVQNWIKKYTRDFYVYLSMAPPQVCSVFDGFYGSSQKKNQFNRILQTSDVSQEFSLNRCEAGRLPKRDNLYLSKPSPGEMNLCSPEDAFLFHLEDKIEDVTDYETAVLRSIENQVGNIQYVSFNPLAMNELKDEKLIRALTVARDKTNVHTRTSPQVSTSDSDKKIIWSNCASFPLVYKSHIQQHLQKVIRVEDIMKKNICYWIDYKPNYEQPELSQITCKICTTGKVNENRGSIHWDAATKEHGCLKQPTTPTSDDVRIKNANFLEKHAETNVIHLIRRQECEADDGKLSGEEKEEYMLRKNSPFEKFYRPTANLFSTVFAAIKMGLSFEAFPFLTNLLHKFSVPLGTLFQNPLGISRILKFWSNDQHADLISHLKVARPKVSIIIDGSVDRSGSEQIVTLMQLVYSDFETRTVLYKYLTVTDGTAEGIAQALIQSFEADGLYDFLKDCMVGYSSDGCATVRTGVRDKLLAWLNNNVPVTQQRNFYSAWCSAHRLELTIAHSFTSFSYMTEFDANINDGYKFFNTKNHKNRNELNDMTIKSGVRPFALKKRYKMRWINSLKRGATTILKNLAVIYRTFVEISANTQKFLRHTRDTAVSLHNRYRDPSFLLHLAWTADLAEAYAEASLNFQKKDVSLIDQMRVLDSLKSKVEELKGSNGKHLSELLSKMNCNGRNGCGLDEVESGIVPVTLHGVSLEKHQSVKTTETTCETSCTNEPGGNQRNSENQDTRRVVLETVESTKESGKFRRCTVECEDVVVDSPVLSTKRVEYVTKLLTELDSYFSPTTEQNFQVLEPTQLTSFVSDGLIEVAKVDKDGRTIKEFTRGSDYAKQSFERLNRWFKWSPPVERAEQFFTDYKDLVTSIRVHATFEEMKNKKASEFWKYYYAKQAIQWTPLMKQVVQTLLAIAPVTSAAERHFSFYNHVKTMQRYSLSPATVDHIVRVMHGHDDDKSTFRRAHKWCANHCRSDDERRCPSDANARPPAEDEWFSSAYDLQLMFGDEIIFEEYDT